MRLLQRIIFISCLTLFLRVSQVATSQHVLSLPGGIGDLTIRAGFSNSAYRRINRSTISGTFLSTCEPVPD